MFHLLHPIWLLGMFAVTVPIVVHLWNRRPGKTLRVGSTILLEESARQSARSLKISEWLLLLLRCLLIVLLALMLAGPFTKRNEPPNRQPGWMLAERNDLAGAHARFPVLMDSLNNAGFTFHYFEPGFPPRELSEALKDTFTTDPAGLSPYWSLITSLQDRVQPHTPVFLFSTHKLKRFAGRRPSVNMELNWKIYTPSSDSASWTGASYATDTDSLVNLVVNSTPYGNSVKQLTRPMQKKDGSMDTATLIISIYTVQYKTDAGYLHAALQAIQQYTKRRMRITECAAAGFVPSKNDILFWLSAEPIPTGIHATKIYQYQSGHSISVNSWLVTGKEQNSAGCMQIYRVIQPDPGKDKGISVWSDAQGNRILSKEKNKFIYHFYTRLHPAWSALPWCGDFPALLMELLFEKKDTSLQKDERLIDLSQIQPKKKDNGKMARAGISRSEELSKPLWLLAFFLLAAERILSMRNKRMNNA